MLNAGIISYGIYIPKYRIKIAEIAYAWKKDPADIEKSLGLREKSVALYDEDAVTIAFEAATRAIKETNLSPTDIDACLVGSESHPYAVNPTSTTVAEYLGLGRNYFSIDLEFACKAGTSAIISLAGLVTSNLIEYGLAIGSDKAQAKPHDILEYTASSAGAAYIIGRKSEAIAEIVDFSSYSSDTPDFWRRDGMRFPKHSGRFTGEPAYFEHVLGASRLLLEKNKLNSSDFDYCIFHMPNGKFPREAGRRLGFNPSQIASSLIIDHIGNPYSASSLIGLSAVLDIARPNQKIFLVSYGSGSGSDGFIIKTTEKLSQFQKEHLSFKDQLRNKQYITYIDYLKSIKMI